MRAILLVLRRIGDRYCLHFLQSNEKALVYLQEAKAWLDAHPGEFLVLWLSRHGNTCAKGGDQYPDVPDSAKHAFWTQVQQLFGDLIFDESNGLLNETTLADMKQRNQRLVIYASDYARFTRNSTRAIDACLIDNQLGDSVSDENTTFPTLWSRFEQANAIKQADKRENRLYLQSMAAGAPEEQIVAAALLHYAPAAAARDNVSQHCAQLFSLPGLTEWCPPTLMDVSLMTNYYNQRILDAAITHGLDLPNAIYIDAVDVAGTIRTGTQLVPTVRLQGGAGGKEEGEQHGTGAGEHKTTAFAYVDTIALYNLQRACGARTTTTTTTTTHHAPSARNAASLTLGRGLGGVAGDVSLPEVCTSLPPIIEKQRAQHPLVQWDERQRGRVAGWPAT